MPPSEFVFSFSNTGAHVVPAFVVFHTPLEPWQRDPRAGPSRRRPDHDARARRPGRCCAMGFD
jgi:hypothetical protein